MDTAENPQAKNSTRFGLVIGAVILLLIVGAGAIFLLPKKSSTKSETATNASMKQTVSPTTANVFSSIQDALSRSLSLECSFIDENGISVVAHVKNGAIRSDITGKTSQESGSMIMKDKKMYFWNGKQGVMLAFDPAEFANITPPQGTTQNPGNVMKDLEKFREHCKNAIVADSLFTLPTDVKFTDMSTMMKPQVSAYPSGTGTTGMTQEQIDQIKKMQEQYQR